MASVTIGGTTYQVGELNFIAMERAWPHIEIAMLTQNAMEAVSAAINVVAAAIMEEEYFKVEDFEIDPSSFEPYVNKDHQIHIELVKKFKRQTKATEIAGIREGLQQIVREAGLEPEPGEADQEVPTENPSTETSTTSSLSSSPPELKEEVGNE